MLESLDQSLAEYEKLADVASENYRQASDFGAWHSWTTALKQFREEAAFYHGQRALTSNGAEVAYLGLDGPMGNASHAFHWLLEDGRKELGWNAQSYAFGDGPFHQAKLVVVYDLSSPWYQRQAAALQTWVQQGGRVLLWDVSPAASPFLEGIRFQHDSSYMPPGYV